MAADRYLFTSESVSMGHPDKVADQVSDAVLDFCLQHDPASRVAQLKAEPRNYGLLAELNTRPRTTYLSHVKNPNPKMPGGGAPEREGG